MGELAVWECILQWYDKVYTADNIKSVFLKSESWPLIASLLCNYDIRTIWTSSTYVTFQSFKVGLK